MIDINYRKAYREVLEILEYIPIEDYNKIPKEKINLFKRYADVDYTFVYNPSKTLEENKVSKITKGIIAILCRDYLVTENQRKKIIIWQKNERKRIENEKKEKYNLDNIFKNRENISISKKNNKDSNSNDLPIKVKNNLFIKIVNYLKEIFHIHK